MTYKACRAWRRGFAKYLNRRRGTLAINKADILTTTPPATCLGEIAVVLEMAQRSGANKVEESQEWDDSRRDHECEVNNGARAKARRRRTSKRKVRIPKLESSHALDTHKQNASAVNATMSSATAPTTALCAPRPRTCQLKLKFGLAMLGRHYLHYHVSSNTSCKEGVV